MRLSLVLALLLALAPVASADLLPPDRAVAPEATSGERWLPTALVGLAIGGLVVVCVTIARRRPSKS